MKNDEKKLTIHHLFWYFLIFSVFGLIIETIYCYISSGTLESRKGLLWGPFCPVYGISGAALIYILDKLKIKSTFIIVWESTVDLLRKIENRNAPGGSNNPRREDDENER